MQLTICCHPKLMARIYNIRLKQCLRNHVRNSRGLYPHTFLLPLEVMLNINSNIHINICYSNVDIMMQLWWLIVTNNMGCGTKLGAVVGKCLCKFYNIILKIFTSLQVAPWICPLMQPSEHSGVDPVTPRRSVLSANWFFGRMIPVVDIPAAFRVH